MSTSTRTLRLRLERSSFSPEDLAGIARESAKIYKEPVVSRWIFLLLARVFNELANNPDMFDVDTSEPVFEEIARSALAAIDAFDQGDLPALCAAADILTEAYCGVR